MNAPEGQAGIPCLGAAAMETVLNRGSTGLKQLAVSVPSCELARCTPSGLFVARLGLQSSCQCADVSFGVGGRQDLRSTPSSRAPSFAVRVDTEGNKKQTSGQPSPAPHDDREGQRGNPGTVHCVTNKGV